MLTKKSGLLELLEKGDSVMADKGSNIQDDLTPLEVKVNIPAFLKGKAQLEPEELVETRHIASLKGRCIGIEAVQVIANIISS